MTLEGKPTWHPIPNGAVLVRLTNIQFDPDQVVFRKHQVIKDATVELLKN